MSENKKLATLPRWIPITEKDAEVAVSSNPSTIVVAVILTKSGKIHIGLLGTDYSFVIVKAKSRDERREYSPAAFIAFLSKHKIAHVKTEYIDDEEE